MLFSSIEFLFIFLPLAIFAFYIFSSKNVTVRNLVLVLFSLFFYGYWKPIYLPVIIISVFINYAIGYFIINDSFRVQKKTILIIGILFNVGILGFFKYLDFAIENTNLILSTQFSLLEITLPLAISFFTFQQIAYLVDSYKGDVGTYSILDYFLFVTFFPQLIAGPIVHHKQMMPQFMRRQTSKINIAIICEGITIFSIGLFKKIVIADYFGAYADLGYADVQSLSTLGAWSTSLSYTVQLYFDFSGYCDMAIGAALLFNIRLPINFNSPYKAMSIQDFWRRWHITLSTWLRDYVYFPLGGNRLGKWLTYRNLFLTFLIGGIWHGAGWGFVLWGAMHGVGLAVHRIWSGFESPLPKPVAWITTILYVHFSWVLFRATSLGDAGVVFKKMLDINIIPTSDFNPLKGVYLTGVQQLNNLLPILLGLVLLSCCVLFRNSNEIAANQSSAVIRTAIFSSLLFTFSVLIMTGITSQTFLYFNF
jgi:D-alanyl-lipoteichoic acid acyltransferase DltB (MBOAT superfamily)